MKLMNVYVATRRVVLYDGHHMTLTNHVFTCPVKAEQWRTEEDWDENAVRYIDVFVIEVP